MYSMDFKRRAVAYKAEGHTFKELKEAFGIPAETYYQWKEKLENGYYGIKTKRERSRKIDREKLKQAIAENPGAYLHELAQPFGCTPQAVFSMLAKLKITLKKRLLPITKNPKRAAPNMQKGYGESRAKSVFMVTNAVQTPVCGRNTATPRGGSKPEMSQGGAGSKERTHRRPVQREASRC
jgi:transposase